MCRDGYIDGNGDTLIIAVALHEHDDGSPCPPRVMIGLTHEELGALVEKRILTGDTAECGTHLEIAVFARRTDDESIAYMEGAMGRTPDHTFDFRPAPMPNDDNK